MAQKLKLRKGDKVVVVAGRERGKKGEILKIFRSESRALVTGVNMVRRHTRPTTTNPGGIIDKEAPLHLSNLAIEDPKTGEPSRIGFKNLNDGRKVRFAKASGEVIDV
jgi:large subunit ribosomal protein L24